MRWEERKARQAGEEGNGGRQGWAGQESQGRLQRGKLLEWRGCALSQGTGVAGLTLRRTSERPRDTDPTWLSEARQGDPHEPRQPPEKSREKGSQVSDEWRCWVGEAAAIASWAPPWRRSPRRARRAVKVQERQKRLL